MRTVLLVVLALLLAGCGGGGSGGGGASEGGLGAPDALSGALRVGGEPVPLAPVALRQDGRVLADATTDEYGEFVFPETRLVASNDLVDVVATVGGARYAATVPPGAGFVWLSELSTLVHDYQETHPGSTYDAANEAVGTALGVPAGEEVTKLSDADIFDPATFQQAAQANGGAAGYLAQVVAGVDTGDYDFSVADPYEVLRVPSEDPHRRVPRAQANLAGEIDVSKLLTKLKSGLASKALGVVSTRVVGWFFGLVGSNSGPSLSDVVNQLSAIETALASLGEDLTRELARAELTGAMNTLSDTSANLTTFAGLQRNVNAQRPPVTDQPFFAQADVADYASNARFDQASAETYANQFLDFLLARRALSTNVVTQYNRFLMREWGRPDPSSALLGYDLRFNELTVKMEDNLNYSLGNLDLAADMAANASHSSFLRPQDLGGQYQGNRLPGEVNRANAFLFASPGQAVARGANDLAALRRRALQQVPPRLPRDDVMALPPEFAMVADTPTIAYRGVWLAFENDPLQFRQFGARQRDFVRRIGAPWQDSENWVLPTLAQMRALDRIAREVGGGNPREGLILLGFLDRATAPATLPGFMFQGASVREVGREGGRITNPRIPPERTFVEVFEFGNPRTGGVTFWRRANRVLVGALFMRGSLSGGTQEQANTILATGTTVRPILSLRLGGGTRVTASARYQFSHGQVIHVDVTDRVEFLSSNTTAVEVSNLDDEAGTLRINEPARTVLSAALLVDSGGPQRPESFVTSQRLTMDAVTGITLQDIEISPRNRIFTATANPAAFLYCTGYRGTTAENTNLAADLTSDPLVRWSLLDPNGQPVDPAKMRVSSAFDGDAVGGILRILDDTLPSGTYTVRTEYFGNPNSQNPTLVDEALIGVQVQ